MGSDERETKTRSAAPGLPGVCVLSLAGLFAGLLAGCAASVQEPSDPPGNALRQIVRNASAPDGDVRARCALAVAFEREGLLGSAERELRDAADLDPRLPAVWLLTAEVAERRGRVRQAEEAWARYFDLRPRARSVRVRWESGMLLTPEWEEVRRRELESVLQPGREAGRHLLRTLGLRSPPGRGLGDSWDPAVTDGVSWEFRAGGLPDFPPPPGSR